ncbi:MAG TPA: hypothetical protein VFT88_14680 [Acidobacteriaceae bacterium]|jgi:hypothetical protein|nr:hypothetical protein [Acidobacteriaceae bacterium]
MGDLPSPANYKVYPKGPNFLLIVILSGIALIIMLILAYFIVSGAGAALLPSAHHTGDPTAQLLRPLLNRIAV